MSDAVDAVIVEREALDRGFSGGLVASVAAHVLVAGIALLWPLLVPSQPAVLLVPAGHFVPIPAGGGGTSNPAPAGPPPAVQKPAPPAEAPAPAPPPKVAKPPSREEGGRNRLPDPDAKRSKKTPTPAAAPVSARPGAPSTGRATGGGGVGGTGTSTLPEGLEFAPVGPGAPGGFGTEGDWYLASVHRKIWMLWARQIQSFQKPVLVRFTILADGQVTDVQVVESSGVSALDFAALRSVSSAAPFNPLPKAYGTNRFTIQALFKPIG